MGVTGNISWIRDGLVVMIRYDLTGEVTAEQARKIKMSVDALKVGKVNYNYNVKK